ncbi:hypothetical protein HUJ04_002650 [Dendroctonus ponderosae]
MILKLSSLLRHQYRRGCSKAVSRLHGTCEIRVRFAPSPTGFLHLGGLRTAFYNFLFAKKLGGTFILRIEDTDQTRKVVGAAEALQDDLRWAGIEIDEGPQQGGSFGPYLQSERLPLYKEHVKILLKNRSAYRCFCSDRRLQLLKKEAVRANEIPKYDNKCRYLSEDEIQKKLARGDPYCVRFQISDKEESFTDLVYGAIRYNVSLNEGDPVILKSDGFPTYHFANVVDDHLMQISHVLRGVEWQISTTKHLLLYKAFGWTPPHFGHLPLLLNSDGSKLSKRQGDIQISHYRDRGIFPIALLNFIASSGGGFEKVQERHVKRKCYTVKELCEQFDFSKINTHSGKLMSDQLLHFNNLALNKLYESSSTRHALIEEVRKLANEHLRKIHGDISAQLSDDYISKVLSWALTRIQNLPELFSPGLAFIWTIPESYNVDQNIFCALPSLKQQLSSTSEFNKEKLNVLLKQTSKEHNLKYGLFMKSLRKILSGLQEGPGIAEMMEILGKENTIRRLDLCLNKSLT